MTVTTAVLGLGRWGRNLVRVLDEQSELRWCCNESDKDAHDWVRKNHASATPTFDIDAVLEDEDIDAVAIATPIATHQALAERALGQDKHVFVEKPLATDSQEARALLELAEERDRVLAVGHVFRHHAAFAALRDRLDKDRPTRLEHEWRKFGSFEEPLTWNILPHPLSLAIELFGTPPTGVDVQAARGQVTELDVLRAEVDFPGGRSLRMDVDRTAPRKAWSFTATTDTDRTFVWHDDTLQELAPEGELVDIDHGTGEPLAREIQSFLSTVRNADSDRQEDARLACHIVETIETVQGHL